MYKKGIMGVVAAMATAMAVALCGCRSAEEPYSLKEDATQAVADDTWSYDGSATVTAAEKKETVNVKADAAGTPSEITVNTKLSEIPDSGVIYDVTNLTGIKNKDGDELYDLRDGILYWQNLGNEISYSGESQEALPVSVTVSYFLDGEKMEPSQIAGKSGHVQIRFDYANSQLSGDVHVPFICMSGMMLSSDHFSNIEVENGTVSDMEGYGVVLGMAMPQLATDLDLAADEGLSDISIPDYVLVSADTDDFELKFTETIVITGIFSGISEEKLSDIKEMTNDISGLAEAGDSLVEGADALGSGFDELYSALESYMDGVKQLSEGLSGLSSGTGELVTGAAQLAEGAGLLADSIAAVDLSALPGYDTGAYDSLVSQLEELKAVAGSLSEGALGLQSGIDSLNSALSQLSEGADAAAGSNEAINDALSAYKDGLSEFADAIRKLNGEGLQELSQKLGTNGGALLDRVEKLRAAEDTYKTFTMLADGQDGSVTFMIETDGIK